jgi:sulfur relay (sulfurtransferase) DsrC/TusE family protein
VKTLTINVPYEFDLNEKGYLNDFKTWKDVWLYYFAKQYGYDAITNDDYENIIVAVRAHYAIHPMLPSIDAVAIIAEMDREQLQKLFSGNLKRNIAMMAGLPGPLTD